MRAMRHPGNHAASPRKRPAILTDSVRQKRTEKRVSMKKTLLEVDSVARGTCNLTE